MDLIKSFSLNLLKYRIAAGMSQDALANVSETTRPFISKVEHRGGNVSLKKVQLMAEALDIEAIDLLLSDEDRRRLMGEPFVGADGCIYALCSVDEQGRMSFSSLMADDPDLAAQVLRALLRRGYTGEAVIEAYNRVMPQIEKLLQRPYSDVVAAGARAPHSPIRGI